MSGITTHTSVDPLPTTSTSESKCCIKEDCKWKKIPEILCCKTDIKTVLTLQQSVTLIILILVVVMALQIPTIIYYIKKPSMPTTYDIGIDFETCSVSYVEILPLPVRVRVRV